MPHVMRPLSFGEILDNAFTLYRRNFSVLFALALVPQLPVVVFWLLAPLLVGTDADAVNAATLLIMPYSIFAWLLMMGALTHATAQAYSGERPEFGAAVRRGLRRWLPLTVASLLAYLLTFIGFVFLIVPGLILLAMFFAIAPAVVLEDRGPTAAMARSRELSRGARMRILGALLVAWLITLLPAMAIWMAAGVSEAARVGAGGEIGEGGWFISMINAASSVIGAVTWPFIIIVTVLLYFDRRARTEAPDLEQAAASLQNSSA